MIRARSPLGAALLLALLGACRAAPSHEDWLSVGFETPEQTLRTFQTGLRGDEPDLEYDSFSDGFRKEHGLSEIAYRELRDEVFSSFPFLRLFATLEIADSRVDSPTVRTLLVRVSALFSERWIEVRFVRDDYYSVRANDRVLADDYASFPRMVAVRPDRLVVTIPAELQPEDAATATHIEVGQEWKIDGFREVNGPTEP